MKYLFCIMGVLVFFTPAFAQKGKAAKILDAGELYSTYEFSEDEKEAIKKQVKPAEFEKIMSYHTEDNWPDGIDNLDERLDLAEKMQEYNVVIIASLEDIYVLRVTPSKNKHMPDAMMTSHDFYFVIGRAGVSK
ncbi:MAG TPA: hypothetical protein VNJ07_14865 [Chitinophagales bacterium]|nr:hypothetical protein [Chitinophagales bacterium]